MSTNVFHLILFGFTYVIWYISYLRFYVKGDLIPEMIIMMTVVLKFLPHPNLICRRESLYPEGMAPEKKLTERKMKRCRLR